MRFAPATEPVAAAALDALAPWEDEPQSGNSQVEPIDAGSESGEGDGGVDGSAPSQVEEAA